jgi:hypothetical protein
MPPTPEQAGQIVTAAWEQDADWGTLVWLVMVTGVRRAELLALRWSDVDLNIGYLTVSRNYLRVKGQKVEKDTKTHQMRRISLDPATGDRLVEAARAGRDLAPEQAVVVRVIEYEVPDRDGDGKGELIALVTMAALLGIDRTLVSKYVSGARRCQDVTQLRRFAKAMDVPPSTFGLIDEPDDAAAASGTANDANERWKVVRQTLNRNPAGGIRSSHIRQAPSQPDQR